MSVNEEQTKLQMVEVAGWICSKSGKARLNDLTLIHGGWEKAGVMTCMEREKEERQIDRRADSCLHHRDTWLENNQVGLKEKDSERQMKGETKRQMNRQMKIQIKRQMKR